MNAALSQLNDADLGELVSAIRSNRVTAPYSELQVGRFLSPRFVAGVAGALQEFQHRGFDGQQIATTLELLLHDRKASRTVTSPIDLVTSGPEAPGITNADTAVVVRELFAHAERSVLVVGYAVYQGQSVFESLARRMEQNPELEVRLFLDIARPYQDSTASAILVSRFARRFRDTQWPAGLPLPEVYYDPRSVDDNGLVRSSLHAKCVVVDCEQVFVSSANFTEAAQERNIEVGLKIQSAWLAERLTRHFRLLREHGLLARVL